GVEGQYTPLGFNNTYAEYDTALGSGSASAESMVFGAQRASLEGFETEDGTYGTRGSWAPGRTEIKGVEGSFDNALGSTDISMGSYGTGPRYEGEAWANPNGSFGAGGKWAGGGYAVSDVNLRHQFGEDGPVVDGSMGKWDTANSLEFAGGWDNETNTLSAHGGYSTGNTLEEAYGSVEGDGWGAHGGVNNFNTGMSLNGDASWNLEEGLNVSSEKGHVGGWHADGLEAGYNIDAIGLRNEASVGSIDAGRTIYEGAEFHAGEDGISANLDKLRTGGFNAEDINVSQEFMGMSQEAHLGGLSNDFLLEGAQAELGLTEGNASFDKLDFGGLRVEDLDYSGDFGDAGQLDMGMESFTNGNTFEGFDMNYSAEEGIHARLDSAGFAGMDVKNANIDYENDLGMYGHAGLESFHTGASVKGAELDIGADGINMSAEHADYYAGQLEGVDLNYGMEGIYENSISMEEGHYNKFSGDNLQAGLDLENGLSLSGDNLEYSYLGLEEFHSKQSIGDGALGTEVDIGSGSLLSGSAGHIDIQNKGLLGGSANIEDLNAHGLQLEDAHVGANIGALEYGIGADELNVLDLNVGEMNTEYGALYSSASGNIEDAQLDLINAKGAGAGYSWNGEEVLGAHADFQAGMGVDSAAADYDILGGTANAEFENLHSGAQLENANVNLFGTEIDIPDMGYEMNASGGGSADVLAGQADANLSLAGTGFNVAGMEFEAGEWAQARAGVDLSEGAANWNVGGDEGVGVDAALWGDDGPNLDVNLFGNEIDVDEGIADAAGWVGDTASDIGSGAADLAGDAWSSAGDATSYVASLLPSISLW
ncbi:MAG: hypothetical protein HN348_03185, partial [Proteobacteria bacterium]|nr:hypothetical protein [Pseudomonadota bacterium]